MSETDKRRPHKIILRHDPAGAITVLFFSAWAELFGRREVGRIQGVAQMLTVLASAVGPLLFALSWRHAESCTPIFLFSGNLTFLPAVLALTS